MKIAPALLLAILAVNPGTVRAAEPEAGLVATWRFSTDRQQGTEIKAAFGGPDISPSGPWKLVNDPPPTRLELPGTEERLTVASDLPRAQMPAQDLSIETWVRIDRPQPRGAILGAIQDNPETQGGWMLGVAGTHFTFAVATGTTPRLTRVVSPDPFQPGHWYHVVGSYDGHEARIYVNGAPQNRATEASGPIAYPAHAPVVIGAFRDAQQTEPLACGIHEIRLYRRALAAAEITARYDARKTEFPEPAPLPFRFRPTYGPFAEWIDRTSARIAWETDDAMPTVVELTGPAGDVRKIELPAAENRHQIVVRDLKPNAEYFYRLHAPDRDGRPVVTPKYLFDTTFYYHVGTPGQRAQAVADEQPATAALASQVLADAGVQKGWCLVAGAHDGRLVLELARQSELKIVVADPDPARVAKVRELLDRAGLYGARASVQCVTNRTLPFGEHLANLVLSESAIADGKLPPWPAAELQRVTRPGTGVILVGSPSASDRTTWAGWFEAASLAHAAPPGRGGVWLRHVKPPLAGTGDWSHQYGSANNTSSSMDERVSGDLQVAWWGDPGPRPMPDRGPRNPSPISVGGRLFIQGDRILFGLDAYNGSILWTLSAPEVRRANLPRDCSNMAGAGDNLFIAHSRYCLVIDGATGARRQRIEVPSLPDRPGIRADWGFLGLAEDYLVGSRVKPESRYLGDDGEWYEDFHPDQIARVTSESLFGVDRTTGAHAWQYQGGAILNSTISIGDSMIFFIESRSPKAMASTSSRIPPADLTDQHLVALDLRSGRMLWEKAHDFSQCEYMTYLVYHGNTVVVTGTDREKVYHTAAFNAPSPKNPPGDLNPLAAGGQVLWSESHKEDKGHHSGHLQHPVVINGVFYSDQRAFDLVTGKTLRTDLPERRGCGVMSAGRNAIFYRHHYQAMWDLATNRRTQFEGIRSGCWLSLIPASGLLLAPETSAGCSCTHAIQTSVAYLPKANPKP